MEIATANLDPLFREIRIRGLKLPNRIVMSPMTRRFCKNGTPDQAVRDYYRRRAMGGVGLILSEGTAVDRPGAKLSAEVPDFFGPALDGWADVVNGVHEAGGRIAPQLWHVGFPPEYQNREEPFEQFESPSGVNALGQPAGRAMTEVDIADTIAAFARSAAAARQLGFDALELHGGHGYLIDQFFWQQTNRRADRWGGSGIEQRNRFAVELVKAVRRELGADIPLSIRVSQWKLQNYEARLAETPEELRSWLEPLAENGVDIFHCSQRRFWEEEFPGSRLNLAGWVKKITGKTTITVGNIGLDPAFYRAPPDTPNSLLGLVRRLEREEFDLVAVGRALLTTPDWPRRVAGRQFEGLHTFKRSDLTRLL